MAFKIYPYRSGSRSARALANALGGRVLRREGSTYRERERDTIINWGSGHTLYRNVLNRPDCVAAASNKLTTFNTLRGTGCSIPDFWVNAEDIPDEAFPIVCRTVLSGHSGAGIVIADDRGGLVRAPLYVRYIKKQDEYRVHVGRREGQSIIIAVQRKARRLEVENPNYQIRNHANGFVFIRNGVDPDPSVIEQAKLAVETLGLDFGGVDVIWNEREGRAYVLEVNSACGLEGSTIEDYADFFRNYNQ